MSNMPSKASQLSEALRHRVLRAVESQDGARFVQYGNAESAGWISLRELHRSPTEALYALSQANVNLLTNRSREECKRAIEAQTKFEQILVARHPGWISDGIYVLGDGKILRRKVKDGSEVIVAMEPSNRFAVRGTLDEWRATHAPLVEGQPLVRLVYAYALVGVLIDFAPIDFQNPILEIIGDTGKGKTSLAVAAASICGGEPQNPNGFCLSWDRTNATFDRLQRQHRDSLLVLNEHNLTGSDAAAQAEFMRTAVMKFTEPGERDTMNSSEAPVYSRLALLSTSNTSVADLIGGKGGSDAAVRSRVLTLRADRPYGVYDTVLHQEAGDLARSMMQAASNCYGTCCRAFIAFLNCCKRGAVTRIIEQHYDWVQAQELLKGTWDDRQLKTLALCRAADHLGRMAGALPFTSRAFDESLLVLASEGSLVAPHLRSARETVIEYLRPHGENFVDVAAMERPITRKTFEQNAGFWIEHGRRCVIPTTRFQNIPDHRRILKVLKESGDLEPEKGRNTKKVPSAICDPSENSRGHFLRISRSDL